MFYNTVQLSTNAAKEKHEKTQRHHPRRRFRHASIPGYPRGIQAAPADLRQADDLLPAGNPDARRHSRDIDHLDAAGYAAVRTTARQWRAVGVHFQLCRAALS